MEWKAQQPDAPGLYFASFQGRAVARVRCEVNEWGILVGKVLLKRPKGVPEEHLRQAGFQEEIPASLDFYEFWKLARRSAKPVSTSLQISRWLVSQPRAALHEGYVRSTTRSMP